MYRFIFILVTFCAPLIAARADLVVEQVSSTTNSTYYFTLMVHAGQMRTDQRTSNGHAFSVIVDLKTRDSITLMPNEKQYLKRSGQDVKIDMQLEERYTHGTNELDQPPAPPTDAGLGETVNGYGTEKYKWTGPRGLIETLWVATNYPDYTNIRRDLARVDAFDATGPHRGAQPQLSLLPGMVVRTDRAFKGHTQTFDLISAKSGPVDPSLFELPADYTLYKPSPPPPRTNTLATPGK
jgi:hypothetical protein